MPDLNHLKRLSAIRSNAGIKFLTSAAFPGSHCPLHPALALAGHIKGLSSLVIGTSECATYSRIVLDNTKAEQGEQHWMYVLDASEVIFGCRRGLIKALHQLEQAGATTILLLATCVPELIGEDIESIIEEAQPELTARLIFVMLGHFKCNSFPAGSWQTLKAVGTLMKAKTVCSDSINVMGRSPDEQAAALPPILHILKQKGFSLRYLAPGSSLDDFLAAPDAVLNLVLSPFPDPLAADMERSFGIPAFRLYNVYDVTEIDAMYSSVAGKLKLQWKNEFCRERTEAAALQEQAKKCLHGCRYIAAHIGPMKMLPLAVYMATLGMHPLLLHMEEFWPNDKHWASILNTLGYDPLICHMVNGISDAPLLEKLAPDLCLGDLSGTKLRIPSVPYLTDLYDLFGYERTSKLIRKLLHALDSLPQ